MRNKIRTAILATIALGLSNLAAAANLRATELSAPLWGQLPQNSPQSIVIIEFRQGDKLPVSLTSTGDLLQTPEPAMGQVEVKRNFWLKVQDNQIQISLDGVTYKDFRDALHGRIEAGFDVGSSGGIARAINMAFRADLK